MDSIIANRDWAFNDDYTPFYIGVLLTQNTNPLQTLSVTDIGFTPKSFSILQANAFENYNIRFYPKAIAPSITENELEFKSVGRQTECKIGKKGIYYCICKIINDEFTITRGTTFSGPVFMILSGFIFST